MDFPKLEKRILNYWRKNKVFEKTLALRNNAPRFVFFEGPPTANGKPGIHHVLGRSFKDAVCRYKTMAGFLVKRKAGWDTHGLPVELQVEKELGFTAKSDIERYGIARFNARCKKSVWEYKNDWERLTERIAFWLDTTNPYITYEAPYMETVWGILKRAWDKKLLYQGHKVVPHCPRCVTTLSSHEVALGYKRIKENSVYVRFILKDTNSSTRTSLLVWTTTPWTLPGNVAVAVRPSVAYVEIETQGGEHLILAKERVSLIGAPHRIIKEFSGETLLGREYEPPFKLYVPRAKTWYVIAGDFVSTQEGTGLVHIAPAFGEEDMEVGRQNELPVFIPVDENGRFNPAFARGDTFTLDGEEAERFSTWQGKFVKELDPTIIAHLAKRGLLFAEELYEHDYPFCWRCDTPLLYYAKQSWFIAMSRLRETLRKENKKITWIPEHLRDGRFGEWLKDVKDWALSRERFWGIPLPAWRCAQCGEYEVIGAIKELRSKKISKNRYLILRHAEANSNVKNVISSWPEKTRNPLTKRGVLQAKKTAKGLSKEKIDFIFSSDLLRCRQTADIVNKKLGVTVTYDARLREFDLGELNGKSVKDYEQFVGSALARFTKKPRRGETWNDVRARTLDFMQWCEQRFARKTILIVGHGDPLWLLKAAMTGKTDGELAELYRKNGQRGGPLTGREISYPQNGAQEHLRYLHLPRDAAGALDLHRPFVDEVRFLCQCGGTKERVKDVIDVWFDSGAMPWAQFATQIGKSPAFAKASASNTFSADKSAGKQISQNYPADFICEAIDQTRGWFYTLLAIGVLLGKGAPYKNVISHGHVLDKNGKKMSKSLGNIVDPWDVIERYGADAVRWYFFTLNPPGEPKLFDEKDLRASFNRFMVTLANTYQFWKTYAPKSIGTRNAARGMRNTPQLTMLDRWILSRLHSLIANVRAKLDAYDIVAAARAIESFVVNDLSNWYVRRSRERFQRPKNRAELKAASGLLGEVVRVTASLSAPFTPFLSEHIFLGLGGPISVHASAYPESTAQLRNAALEDAMGTARGIAELGLELRARSGIKVRQPLAALQVQTAKEKIDPELLAVAADELNVQSIEFVDTLQRGIGWLAAENDAKTFSAALDTRLTNELRQAGLMRELIRHIQEIRKEASFTPKQQLELFVATSGRLHDAIERNSAVIQRGANLKRITFSWPQKRAMRITRELTLDGIQLRVGLP